MLQRLYVVLWVSALLLSVTSRADHRTGEAEISFPEVWAKIEAHSPSEKAANYELDAAQTAESRSGRHWFPVIYGDARAYSTNDPGISLFSTLSQRAIAPTDFSPGQLNHPPSATYGKYTLGANLPVFEGGTRVAQHNAAEKMAAAKDLQRKAVQIGIYTEAAKLYGNVLTEIERRVELDSLNESIDTIISKYKLGAKENPVGYSGLLGLKNVKNRVSGARVENSSKIDSVRGALAQMAETLPEAWQPKSLGIAEFVKRYLSSEDDSGKGKISYRVATMQEMAAAVTESEKTERAKFLPRVGLFAEGNLYSGNRDTATSYVGGAYLQWDLFVAPNIGAVKQAESTAAAADAHAVEARLQEDIENQGSLRAAGALESNLKILEQSSALLSEQTEVAKKLFLNGSMNALQLAEVLNRRIDLINAFAEAKTQYVTVKATLAKNHNYQIPGTGIGGNNE
jgi:outer membrane protein TolC